MKYEQETNLSEPIHDKPRSKSDENLEQAEKPIY